MGVPVQGLYISYLPFVFSFCARLQHMKKIIVPLSISLLAVHTTFIVNSVSAGIVFGRQNLTSTSESNV